MDGRVDVVDGRIAPRLRRLRRFLTQEGGGQSGRRAGGVIKGAKTRKKRRTEEKCVMGAERRDV